MVANWNEIEHAGLCDCGCETGVGPAEPVEDGCDLCHHRGFEVSEQAMRTQLPPQHWPAAGPGFRFCATEWCAIVYFNDDTGVYFSRQDVLPIGKYKSDYLLRRERAVTAQVEAKTFKVSGITCQDCITHIADNVLQLPGARKVSGNLAQSTVKVGFDAGRLSVEEITHAIEEAGYIVDAVEP